MTKSSSRSEGILVERIKPLLADIRARAPAIEAARQIPKDIIEQLVQTGLLRAMMPAERGGGEDDVIDWLQAIRLLASADMATGWVAGLLACHANSLAYFDKRAQDEVWASGPDAIIGTSGAPLGRIRRVAGGVHLSGRFPFASGCDYCAWTILGFVLEQSDSREAGFYFCVVPSSDYRIEDDWFTSGLRGTGSKTLVLEDAFVPEHRWFGPGLERGPVNPGLYKNPMFNETFLAVFNAPFAAIMLGGAEGALEAATEALKSRTASAINAARTVDYAPRQIRLAEAALEIRGAAALMEKNWGLFADRLREGRAQTMADMNWWRAEDAHAARLARHAVEHLMTEAGGSAHYDRKSLQRFWRDIHTGCEHPWLDLLGMSHVIGRMMLGLPLEGVLVM